MKIYAEVLEDEAFFQFEEAMSQDFTVDGALMPDAHLGYALPIGAVVSTKDVIVPAWVGYDIGCGMCALKLMSVTKKDIELHSKDIFDQIYKVIPVGHNVNDQGHTVDLGDLSVKDLTEEAQVAYKKGKGKYTLGTLGGGNHFIEIGYDENENVWIIIHSGSRGVGHKIATHYMKLAKELNSVMTYEEKRELELIFEAKNCGLREHVTKEKFKELTKRYVENNKPKVDKILDGHFGLDVNSEEGKNYINDLNWCLEFALLNRKSMIKRVSEAIVNVLGKTVGIDMNDLINRNHNHAELSNLEGKWVWVHRKGATHAEDGMMGVIPGNMRDGSFIVRGKGNPESLYSSSHGAGRVLGRKEAKRQLNVEDFKEKMVGVTGKIDEDTLDESPDAYKNIFEVMDLQKDLVEVLHHIKPLINIKG